jgi:hypothetical protein
MYRIQASFGRSGLIHIIGAALLAAAIVGDPGAAWANPLPPAATFTHVQPHDPDFCTATTIMDCDQIMQTTGESGLLDFGVFFQPTLPDPVALTSIDLVIEWPAEWGYVEIEGCCGTASVNVLGNRADVVIPLDPGYTMADFFPILRVTADVTVPGRLEVPEGHFVAAGSPPEFLGGYPAWAAMGCRTCAYACDFSDACIAGTDTDRIELAATVGGVALGGFHGWASGMDPLCDVAFNSAAPWLGVEVMPSGLGGYDITLVADATGLAPDTYETWVDAVTPMCQACVQVVFTVTGCSPAQGVSWGAIKHVFR